MCPLRGQSLESRLAAQPGVSQAVEVSMKSGSTPLGVFDHLAGAIALVVVFSLAPRVIGALLSILSSAFLERGSFIVIGPVSWEGNDSYWGLLFVVALVGGIAVALDRLLSKGIYRAIVPPLAVGLSLAMLTWVVPPLHEDGSTPIASGIAFGMVGAAMFSVWWFTALGVARLRRSTRLGKA